MPRTPRGAEHLRARRSASPDVAQRLIKRIHWWEEYTARHCGSIDNNPQPGNKTGGLTTIIEKSLGAVSKAGTTNLNQVYLDAEPIAGPTQEKGLVFMDSPGFDPVSATGQVASGANLLCFTTGRGSVFGCKSTPSLKLASNTALYDRMADDMDTLLRHHHGRRPDGRGGRHHHLSGDARRGLRQTHPKCGARLRRRGVSALASECDLINHPLANSAMDVRLIAEGSSIRVNAKTALRE